MALKAVVDGIAALPEGLREHYREDEGGRYVLNVEPAEGYSLENIDGLKSALAKERTARERIETALKRFEGFDPAAEADRIASERIRTLEEETALKHSREIEEAETRVKRLTREMERTLVEAAAVRAVAEARGAVDLLMPHIRGHTRLDEARDGTLKVVVVDDHGHPRLRDDRGTPMDIGDLVAEMRLSKTFSRAFEGSGASGSGMPPQGGSAALPPRKPAKAMTVAEKAAFIREHGSAAWARKVSEDYGA